MKIGEVVQAINTTLIQDNHGLSADYFIDASKINAYRKMNLITPLPEKTNTGSYFEFTQQHIDLILTAHKSIVFQHLRTRDAFRLAREAIESPMLFN